MKIWNWLNGKKRTLGIIIIFVAQAPHLVDIVGQQPIDIMFYLGSGLAGTGVIHAFFKDKK